MKSYYRVCHYETLQGLWYAFNGDFTGLIHDKFKFCLNNELELECNVDPEYDKKEMIKVWLPYNEIITEAINIISERK